MRGIALPVCHIVSPLVDTPSSVQTASHSYSAFYMLSNQKGEVPPFRSLCRQRHGFKPKLEPYEQEVRQLVADHPNATLADFCEMLLPMCLSVPQTLKKPLGFKSKKPPNRTTISRLLAKISLQEMQEAFAVFLMQLLQETSLTAAVDGKVSKQILDEDGDVLQMLNVFVHDMKIVLWEWSVKGNKTNEPGCLKNHLGELLSQFPHLKLLTGDAIFAQRPLLEVLKTHHVDYVFQVNDNQPEVLDAVKETFRKRQNVEPVAKSVSKKTAA